MPDKRKTAALVLFTLILLLVFAGSAYATATGMPWEGPLDRILNSLAGPVARVMGAIAIIAFGMGIAFSEGGSGLRKGLWVVMGLTITFNALTWGLSFVGYGGGLVI